MERSEKPCPRNSSPYRRYVAIKHNCHDRENKVQRNAQRCHAPHRPRLNIAHDFAVEPSRFGKAQQRFE